MNKMFDCLLYTEAQAKATNEVMEIYKMAIKSSLKKQKLERLNKLEKSSMMKIYYQD